MIESLAKKKTLRIAGLMSGTSIDGIDAAIVDCSKKKITPLSFSTTPYPDDVRQWILDTASGKKQSAGDLSDLNALIGQLHSLALERLCKESNIPLKSIDLIGSHGQTIHHNPDGRKIGKHHIRSTYQIGQADYLSQRFGACVIHDFRSGDLATGGQGAPLVPFADAVLFRHNVKHRAIQNIGGIGNVTYLPAGKNKIIGFDTGPGNMLIDMAITTFTKGKNYFDDQGNIAAQGSLNKPLLKSLMKHPYFKCPPPKSTGRELFSENYFKNILKHKKKYKLSQEDVIATLTAFTAESICMAYKNYLPKKLNEVILCGGGVHNNTLVSMLKKKLAPIDLLTSDDFGIDCDAKEAICFAILARETIYQNPVNSRHVTGAKRNTILGKITLPS